MSSGRKLEARHGAHRLLTYLICRRMLPLTIYVMGAASRLDAIPAILPAFRPYNCAIFVCDELLVALYRISCYLSATTIQDSMSM